MSYYQWAEGVEVCLANHEVYHSKEDVMDAIKENEQQIPQYRMQLFGMVCGSPKDLFAHKDEKGYGIDPIETALMKFNQIFDEENFGLLYLVSHNVKLRYIYDNWDKVKEG